LLAIIALSALALAAIQRIDVPRESDHWIGRGGDGSSAALQ
jgi:hypothetical protein